MESPPFQGTVIAKHGLYCRSVPASTGNIPIGRLAYGSQVEADRKQDVWWHLTRINRADVTEESWACEGADNTYIRREVDVITTPATGRVFAYVLRNFERPGIGVSRPTQNGSALRVGGLPDTVKLLERIPVFRRSFMVGMDRNGVLATGNSEAIQQAATDVFTRAPERFILAADCTVPGDTPWENLKTIIETAHYSLKG